MSINEAVEVIKLLPNEFDSHDFIKAYILKFTTSYMVMVDNADKKKSSSGGTDGVITIVDRIIGAFLQRHQDDLNIQQLGKKTTENILGRESDCEKWKKK